MSRGYPFPGGLKPAPLDSLYSGFDLNETADIRTLARLLQIQDDWLPESLSPLQAAAIANIRQRMRTSPLLSAIIGRFVALSQLINVEDDQYGRQSRIFRLALDMENRITPRVYRPGTADYERELDNWVREYPEDAPGVRIVQDTQIASADRLVVSCNVPPKLLIATD
jgi:hypothetical protein